MVEIMGKGAERARAKKAADETAFTKAWLRLIAATAALNSRIAKKPPRRYPSRAVCPCRNIKQARHVNLQFIAWCEKRGIAPQIDELLL